MWLQKLKYAIITEYPYFECDIEPDGFTLAKLADVRNVMTDGFN